MVQPEAAELAPGTSPCGGEYDPEPDVRKLAGYFAQKYGSLELALDQFERNGDFDLYEFEASLKKWGIQNINVVELFGHIDVDYSGTISVQELFNVLELPLQKVMEREELRRQKEVRHILEELAQSIRRRYGSIDEYFTKTEGGASNKGSSLSLAKFGKLVRDVGIALDDGAVMQRVHNHIKREGSDNVTWHDLQKAVNQYLHRGLLGELAGTLISLHGTTKKFIEGIGAFSDRGDNMAGARSSSVPTLPGVQEFAAHVARVPSDNSVRMNPGEMSEANLLLYMRKMGVIDHLEHGQETVRLLHSLMQPFILRDFTAGLEEVEAEREKEKKRNEEAEKNERDRNNRAARGVNSRRASESDVQKWVEMQEQPSSAPKKATASVGPQRSLLDTRLEYGADTRLPPGVTELPGGLLEDVTRHWSATARAGKSKVQLKDYVSVLEKRASDYEEKLEDTRLELQSYRDEAEKVREFLVGGGPSSLRRSPEGAFTPSPSLSTAGAFTPDHSISHTPAVTPASCSRTPSAPRAAWTRPARAVHAATLSQEEKTARAEHLSQAAAAGDVVMVQRILAVRTNPNLVVWGGVTALMTAAHHGRQAVLECLLARHADIARTDMRGRTAVDHAHKRPAVREWLRASGGMTGREMAAEVEALAQRVLLAGAEKARLEVERSGLPSDDVLRQAQLRMQLSAAPTPRAPQAYNGRPAWPAWPSGGSSPRGLVPSPCLASPAAGFLQVPVGARQSPPGARHGAISVGGSRPVKKVNIMLPDEAIHGPGDAGR